MSKSSSKILTQSDAKYSYLLKEIPDPPRVLHVLGNLPDDKLPKIAVVGSRQVTEYGAFVTRKFTRALVKAGFVIVSGFMYGTDAIAHETAIACGGKTIGVLGFGLNHMYPTSHLKLKAKMLASGNCLISEYEDDVRPIPKNFPQRNRIVAGLCKGVLVTQAAKKSGTMITARLAAEQGREVFAVPGPIDSLYAQGTKELVNLGAKLVTNIDDILAELLQY